MNFRKLLEQKSQIIEESLDNGDYTMNEAKFSEKNLAKVGALYSKIMGKKMGADFKPIGIESYKRKSGPGKGFRFINNKGAQLRFNWDSKLGSTGEFDFTSIDYWNEKNTDFQHPSRTVRLSSGLNVVQILGKICDALISGKLKESKDIIQEANLLLEKRNTKEKAQWLIDNNLPKSYTADKDMRKVVKKKKPELSEELEVFLGEKESNTFEGEIKAVESKFNDQVYADPETVFDDIDDLLGIVASGQWRTLIVCGMGGVGKTYGITEGPRSLKRLLGPEGGKWTYHSGTKASPLSFYRTLFQERNKIIVFDEADSFFKSAEISMMLKPILDTSGSNMAEYITGTKNMVGRTDKEIEEYSELVDVALASGAGISKDPGKKVYNPFEDDKDEASNATAVQLPSKFKFEGGMVFISNMRAKDIDQAIMSRSIFIDVYLAEQDVLKRIKTIGYAQAKKSSDTTEMDIDEVLEALGQDSSAPEHKITYMTPEYARQSKEVTVRAMQLALVLKKSGLSRWKELAALYA